MPEGSPGRDEEGIPNGLLRSVSRGTAWNLLAFSSSKLAAFLATIVLARILAPADFGLLALGLLVLRFLRRLSSFGIAAALIQRQDKTQEASTVAFYLSLVLGIGMTAVAAFAAPAISLFFKEPDALWIIRALSVSFTITALATVPEARLRKELDFRRRVRPQIIGALCKGVSSVALAVSGFGVWSLVGGQLLGESVQMIAYWKAAGWRPGRTWDSSVVHPLLTFGSKLLLLGLLVELLNNLDYIVIGRMMSSADLGHYTIAYRLPELVILSVCYVISQAAFPAYARLQSDRSGLRQGFLTSVRWITLVTFPAGFGMALVAKDFVSTFYGDPWMASVVPMQLLAVYTVLFSIPFNAGDVYKASNRVGILFRLELARLVVLAPAMFFAARYGISGVAFAHLLVMSLYATLTLIVACKVLGASSGQLFAAVRTPLVATLAMAAVALPMLQGLAEHGAVVRLLLVVVASALVYTLTALGIDRSLIADIREL